MMNFRQETLQELQKRNTLRYEFGFPLIDWRAELDAALEREAERPIQEFIYGPCRKRIEDKMLRKSRQARNDPNWRPWGMFNGGMAFSMDVSKRMRKIYNRLEKHNG